MGQQRHRTAIVARRADSAEKLTAIVWREGRDVVVSLDSTWHGAVRFPPDEAAEFLAAVQTAVAAS